MILAAFLLIAPRALAWEQVLVATELTITLGARTPLGFALEGEFAEAPLYRGGPQYGLGGEVAFGPGGPALTPFGRFGVMAGGVFGVTHWAYVPLVGTYMELGYTWRPRASDGPRVGGGVQFLSTAVRYHQLVRLTRPAPAAAAAADALETGTPAADLALPARHPRPTVHFPDLDMKLTIATGIWLLPRPLSFDPYA